MQFGYGYCQTLVDEIGLFSLQFVENLVKSLRPLALVTSKEIEQELVEQKIAQFESNGFKPFSGLNYCMADAFDMHATMMQLYVNYGMPFRLPQFSSSAFEASLPPQYTIELLVDCLQNSYLRVHFKV